MKVIIAGGRDFFDYEKLRERCDYYLQNQDNIEIISGGAKGADLLAEKYAKEKGYPIQIFKADWHVHGKSAGAIRNSEMAKHGDSLIAFWDKKSKGTALMIKLAKRKNLKVKIVYY